MDNEINTWLYDILNAINEIDSFIGNDVSLEIFQGDIRTKRAIEKTTAVIGEAMNRILKKDSNINISNARQIVDVRNRIIHGYDTVSDNILWAIVTQYLPILQREVSSLLHE